MTGSKLAIQMATVRLMQLWVIQPTQELVKVRTGNFTCSEELKEKLSGVWIHLVRFHVEQCDKHMAVPETNAALDHLPHILCHVLQSL